MASETYWERVACRTPGGVSADCMTEMGLLAARGTSGSEGVRTPSEVKSG